MKKLSTASLTEIVRKNKSSIAAFSLLLMIIAASSILFCEERIKNLEKKWQSFCQLNEVREYADPKGMAGSQPRDLTRYDIKASLTRMNWRRAEILLCDNYSFIMTGDHRPSGVYHKTRQGKEEYVSKVEYPCTPIRTMAWHHRWESHNFRFKCDLVEKTILVYMNGKFMEKVPLGPEPVHYAFGLALDSAMRRTRLNELEISDQKGNVLFNVNVFPLFFYKFISQTCLFLGVLIFFALACSERFLFKKALFFVFPLLFLETFLRVAYPHDPGLDIDQLKPRWRFGISTNFYGAFNDPKELTIRSYWNAPRAYLTANPEHATRIICVGASAIAFYVPSTEQTFPALLEKKLNAWNQKKNTVIPLAAAGADTFCDIEINVYLREVLNKMDPDIILYYGNLASPKAADYKEKLKKDYALYQRAKRVMEKNSDWIKNDRLLYAALEFKEPVKEIVYLYDFLCRSYLFMAAESFRKNFLDEWHSGDRETLGESPDSLFKEVVELCKKRGIKVVFIPQPDFSASSNDKQTENFLADLRREHPEIFYLSVEGIFDKNKSFLLARDHIHPSEYGHQVIAEEIFRQLRELIEKGPPDLSGALKNHAAEKGRVSPRPSA